MVGLPGAGKTMRPRRLPSILPPLSRVKPSRSPPYGHALASFVDFFTMLLHDEVERRALSKLRLHLRRAAFDSTKTLESFDFAFNPKLNKAQIFDLATGQFIERHESVLAYGPTGVGKSHVAQALAHEACRRGDEVLFINTDKMLAHLRRRPCRWHPRAAARAVHPPRSPGPR